MNNIIHALETIGFVGLALFGAFYSSQKVMSIWLCFVSLVFLLAAGCLTWTQKVSPKPEFTAGITGSINIKSYPGPLIFIYDKSSYDSKESGKSGTFISHAIHLELTNDNNVPVSLHSYKIRALLKFDEGGKINLTRVESEIKPEYIPSGRTVKKWRDLYSVGPLNDQVYYINTWTKARQIDFIKYSFDNNALHKEKINPGESIKGWMLFEVDEDVRYQPFEIIQYEMTFENSAGQKTALRIPVQKEDDETINSVSGGAMKMLYDVDLTKVRFSICSIVDLKKAVKKGEPLITVDFSK